MRTVVHFSTMEGFYGRINIPFFYYDVVARIFPGAATLGFIFTVSGLPVWFSGTDTWKAAVVPLVLAGCSYVIGVLFEAVSPDWLVWRRVGNTTFNWAARDYDWVDRGLCPDLQNGTSTRIFRDHAWNALVLAEEAHGKAQAFAHALRFWADAKMCLHVVVPALAFGVFFLHSWNLWGGLAALAIAVWLIFGVFSRDRRRWIQVLFSIEHLPELRSQAHAWRTPTA